MSETILERAVSFFRNPERCRQNYDEAWAIGKAVYEDRESLRTQLATKTEECREWEKKFYAEASTIHVVSKEAIERELESKLTAKDEECVALAIVVRKQRDVGQDILSFCPSVDYSKPNPAKTLMEAHNAGAKDKGSTIRDIIEESKAFSLPTSSKQIVEDNARKVRADTLKEIELWCVNEASDDTSGRAVWETVANHCEAEADKGSDRK